MAHTNKMRNYIIEKKFLLPTYLILLPNNKCIPKLQQYLPIPSHPSPRKKEIQIPKECVLSRSLFPTYLIPRSAVAADRVNLGWCLFRVRCRGVGFGRVSC